MEPTPAAMDTNSQDISESSVRKRGRGRPRKNQNEINISEEHRRPLIHAVRSVIFKPLRTVQEEDPGMLEYEMMPEHRPVLRNIFRIHGDIAKDCSATEKLDRERWLEMVSKVVIDLSKNDDNALDISNLNSKMATVRGIQYMKVKVDWLITNLDELISGKQVLDKLKEEQEEGWKQFQILKNEYNEWDELVKLSRTGRSLVKDSLQKKAYENSKLTETVSAAESEFKKKLGKTLSAYSS